MGRKEESQADMFQRLDNEATASMKKLDAELADVDLSLIGNKTVKRSERIDTSYTASENMAYAEDNGQREIYHPEQKVDFRYKPDKDRIIMLTESMNPEDNYVVVVWVNGKKYALPRGVRIKVNLGVINALVNAGVDNYQVMLDPGEVMRTQRVRYLRYPFTILGIVE